MIKLLKTLKKNFSKNSMKNFNYQKQLNYSL